MEFQFHGLFDVQPGHILVLTDGVTTKEHTVTSLTVTGVDPDLDAVSGAADPGSDPDGAALCELTFRIP